MDRREGAIRRTLYVAIGLLAVSLAPAEACDLRAGKAVAETLTTTLAQLVGFTSVQCAPTAEAGKCSIVCTTTSLESEANVNILLTAITAIAAKRGPEVGLTKLGSIAFADKNLLQKRQYLAISAADVVRVQKTIISAGGSPLSTAAAVRGQFTQRSIP